MDEPQIVSSPDVMLGKPCVRGTRITVEYILDSLAGGATIDQLVRGHRNLSADHVLAAIAFGADAVRSGYSQLSASS